MRQNDGMEYEIETTNIFDDWLASLKSDKYRARIVKRFDHIELGNFGDHKQIEGTLYELRFFFGPGFRVYYVIRNKKVVLLLSGGDKSKQQKDIKNAKNILKALEKTDESND